MSLELALTFSVRGLGGNSGAFHCMLMRGDSS